MVTREGSRDARSDLTELDDRALRTLLALTPLSPVIEVGTLLVAEIEEVGEVLIEYLKRLEILCEFSEQRVRCVLNSTLRLDTIREVGIKKRRLGLRRLPIT